MVDSGGTAEVSGEGAVSVDASGVGAVLAGCGVETGIASSSTESVSEGVPRRGSHAQNRFSVSFSI